MAPGVHVATAELYATTSTIVVGGSGSCLVVDPALSSAELHGLAAVVRSRGWHVDVVLSTHAHWDHLLGRGLFPGVPHLASPAASAWAAEHREVLHAEAEAACPSVSHYLDDVAPDGPVVTWPGGTAELLVHDAHAPGHTAVLLPGKRALLAGDMLSDREVPLLDLDHADPLRSYRAGLDLVAARLTDVDVVVPGHGTPAGTAGARARLAADLRYLDALEAGRASDDVRLADPWVRGEHERQVAALHA